MSKPSEKAIQIAAQCWCDEETEMIEMDTRLACAFAKRLDNDYAAIAELTECNLKLRADLEVAVDMLKSLDPLKALSDFHVYDELKKGSKTNEARQSIRIREALAKIGDKPEGKL